jgi:hypothetical protein
MAVTLLWRLEGSPAAGATSGFGDVQMGQWFFGAVAWAYENEILGAFSGEAFAPGQNVTRQEFITLLSDYAPLIGLDDTADLTLLVSTYALGNVVYRGEAAAILRYFIELVE